MQEGLQMFVSLDQCLSLRGTESLIDTGSYKSRVVAIKQFRIYGQDDDWQKTKKVNVPRLLID